MSTRRCVILLDSFKETLTAGGMTDGQPGDGDHLLSRISTLYDKFNAVYRSYFGKDCPARRIHRLRPTAARRTV
jgi:hypothetical protein